MKKNNKGFTLIELLAVIVVLAIIMVIATTQVNGTIQRSRKNSFVDAAKMVERNANMLCASEGSKIDLEDLKDTSDIDDKDEDYELVFEEGKIELTGKGQFSNAADFDNDNTDSITFTKSGNNLKATITPDSACILEDSTDSAESTGTN